MKRILFTTFAAYLIALSAWANGTEIDGIYYVLDSSTKTASVTYTGTDYNLNPNSTAYQGNITIPATVTYGGTTYSVTSIGNYAFFDCSGLTSITIPSSVTSIRAWAFQYCSGTSFTIPNSVTDIGQDAFYQCSGLTSINLPSVTYIGGNAFADCTGLTSVNIGNADNYTVDIQEYVFSGCTSLTSITIPSSATSIGSGAFSGCKSLTSINIPKSVTNIGDNAFYQCTGLTSINIPNSVTTIGGSAFESCSGLTSIKVEAGNTKYDSRDNCNAIIETASNTLIAGCMNSTIPNSVTSIGSSAFEDCKGLTSITIPNSVTSIGDYAFEDCKGLTSITIPNSVTTIGIVAFWGCSGLTSVTIGNSVTTIGNNAFGGCTGLTSINIPNSVTSIASSSFDGCTGLTSIKVAAGNTKYDSRDNCNAIIETASNTLIRGCKATSIPASVTSIGERAFYYCTSLTSIEIPSSVTTIGRSAFEGCTGLTSITIPNSVTSIGIETFRVCTGLTSVTIPNSVTNIGEGAFYGCKSLTSINIPKSVTNIGDNAFYQCTGLTSITIPNSVTTIGSHAFHGCTSLTSITIPNSVTSIGYAAFDGCTGLTSITLSWEDPTNCTYGGSMLYGVPTSATLYVPVGTKALYENTEPWSSFENIVEWKSVITLNNTMGTYCDASGLDFSSVEGLEAYTATGYASGEVTLTRVNYVPANTGIVLRGTAGVYGVPQQKVNVFLTNLLKGTTSPITLNQTEGDMTNYILANGSKGIGFYKVASGGGTLAANKAYLQLPSNLSATRPMMLRFEDEDGQTTDIQYLYTSSDDETAPAIFDLQGRRVSGTMQQGGIYIVGGKKVMAK